RIGGELSDNLAGDVRVSKGAEGVADGDPIPNVTDVVAAIRAAAPGSRAAPRLEAEALFLHNASFSTGRSDAAGTRLSAGILVGVDPALEAAVVPLRRYLVEGATLDDPLPEYRTPQGIRLVPIVAGKQFLATSNVSVARGEFTWDAVFNVTAGRLENNNLVTIQAIVVGEYETGFRMIDRAVVYAPRGEVARLLGDHPGNPPANVLLVRTSHPEAAAAEARALGLTAILASGFRESYLGPVFDTVRVVAWAIVATLTVMTAAWFAHTLGHHVRADRRKIATLRAIGLPQDVFARVYVSLGVALGLAGGAVGLAVAWALNALVEVATAPLLNGRPFVPRLSAWEGAGLLVLSVAMAGAAALVALQRLRGEPIRDALREA
ncbi:MAG TPA: FtsX-like permease family protein, partial [Candidatus Thermoplasmatota archaeon]|nr:FtsX-like permease family protein [Candidatus Thermoplasmatota archaeon]